MIGFLAGKTVDQNYRRIYLELLNDSLEQLARDPSQSTKIIHEVRKDFKKLRALLRLVRYDLGEKIYKRQNYFFRDLGRELSDARDADSNIETFKQVVKHKQYWQNPNAETVATIQRYLDDRRYHLHLYDIKTVDLFGSLEEKLKRKKEQLRENDKELPDDFDIIAAGLKKIYKKGLKRYDDAYPGEDTDTDQEDRSLSNISASAYHEWRKEVKYLRYQLDILDYIWPDLLTALEEEAHELTDLLGLEHDLQVLKETLKKAVKNEQWDVDLKQFFDEIAVWQVDLRKQAKPYGRRIYAEKPKRFIKRIKIYQKTQQQIALQG